MKVNDLRKHKEVERFADMKIGTAFIGLDKNLWIKTGEYVGSSIYDCWSPNTERGSIIYPDERKEVVKIEVNIVG